MFSSSCCFLLLFGWRWGIPSGSQNLLLLANDRMRGLSPPPALLPNLDLGMGAKADLVAEGIQTFWKACFSFCLAGIWKKTSPVDRWVHISLFSTCTRCQGSYRCTQDGTDILFFFFTFSFSQTMSLPSAIKKMLHTKNRCLKLFSRCLSSPFVWVSRS